MTTLKDTEYKNILYDLSRVRCKRKLDVNYYMFKLNDYNCLYHILCRKDYVNLYCYNRELVEGKNYQLVLNIKDLNNIVILSASDTKSLIKSTLYDTMTVLKRKSKTCYSFKVNKNSELDNILKKDDSIDLHCNNGLLEDEEYDLVLDVKDPNNIRIISISGVFLNDKNKLLDYLRKNNNMSVNNYINIIKYENHIINLQHIKKEYNIKTWDDLFNYAKKTLYKDIYN